MLKAGTPAPRQSIMAKKVDSFDDAAPDRDMDAPSQMSTKPPAPEEPQSPRNLASLEGSAPLAPIGRAPLPSLERRGRLPSLAGPSIGVPAIVTSEGKLDDHYSHADVTSPHPASAVMDQPNTDAGRSSAAPSTFDSEGFAGNTSAAPTPLDGQVGSNSSDTSYGNIGVRRQSRDY